MDNIQQTFWDIQLTKLEENKTQYGLSNLLRWPVINTNMFMKNPIWTQIELEYLQSLPDWSSRWEKVIIESEVCNPVNNFNLIHMAYHLAQFEIKSNTKIDEISYIFEFGGGYGCLCKLVHALGFTGTYTIYDLPQFSKIQKYYLDQFTIHPNLLSGSLETFEPRVNSSDNNLFIATWSLSESLLKLRKEVTEKLTNFNNFLISYQKTFENVDNIQYFVQFSNIFNQTVFRIFEIDHIKNNYYMIGSPN